MTKSGGTDLAGLKVAHLMASPSEQPVKREKLRTQVSRVTTLSDCRGQKVRRVPCKGKVVSDVAYLPARVSVPSR